MIQEEARLIAEKLGYSHFEASNGWLVSFKSRHNLKQLTVKWGSWPETVEAWQEKLKVLLRAEKIWNEDETGCFYTALLSERKKECRGGKKSNADHCCLFC